MSATAAAPNTECEITPTVDCEITPATGCGITPATDCEIPSGTGEPCSPETQGETSPEAEGETSLEVEGESPPEEPLHEACNYTQNIWLHTFHDQHTPVAKHEWCVKTGIIRNRGGEEARPMGFFITVLGELQVSLEREWNKTHMVALMPQSQLRKIHRELNSIPGFADRWWRTESSQVHEFVRAVRYVRPDITERTIVETVTRMW